MEFRIADTFTESLARLTGDEQKSVKTTAFDLQMNPANLGMSFHRLDRARDRNFWSVRVSGDIRLIVHRNESSLMLCYVGHHDDAYSWAERRKLETHPKTGAAQLVEIRETVKEIVRPVYTEPETQPDPRASGEKPPILAGVAEDRLLSYGVPIEWLNDVKAATEDSLLSVVDHLPAEAAEALLQLATGGQPNPPQPARVSASPFDHPDAQRRFRVVGNLEELERALEYPWDKWTVFLHPEQRELVEGDFGGPVRVSGSAGTGKTIVALHRAAYLARSNTEARVLLTTFSTTLANALRARLRRLIGNEPRLGERIDVHSLDEVGIRLHRVHVGPADVATREAVRGLVRTASTEVGGHKFSVPFLVAEWEHVVDAWQLKNWEGYRDVVRLGRRTRISEGQRKVLWSVFEHVSAGLAARGVKTMSSIFSALAEAVARQGKILYDYVVVDEAQDVSVAQLRFLAALAARRPNSLFFAGDTGQRIYQQPFSWRALGVDIRGRSNALRVNYRTSHQIRTQADRLLGPVVSDADGNPEERGSTVSVFNGAHPVVKVYSNEGQETGAVAQWIRDRQGDRLAPHEIAVFVRSDAELGRAQAAVDQAGLSSRILDTDVQTAAGHVSICTMHLAKGLEFRAVAIMACDDEVIPLQERIESVGDDAELEALYETERHLLYVACTRARDFLYVTGVEPASEFLDDMKA
jgi:hypothetical protein